MDTIGIIQSILIPLVGWIGIRIERVLSRISKIDTDVRILSTQQKDHKLTVDRIDDDVRYLMRKGRNDA